jgi:hypothetical protein
MTLNGGGKTVAAFLKKAALATRTPATRMLSSSDMMAQ